MANKNNKMIPIILGLIVLAVMLYFAVYDKQDEQSSVASCEVKEKIKISEMNWESAGVMAYIVDFILSKGYGCETELVPGATVPTGASILSKGEPHITPELWVGSLTDVWNKIKAKGDFYEANKSFKSAGEGWWVPQYVLDENPGLKTIYDLPKYAHLFEEPGSRGKGRFYNCPPGWACEIVNDNYFKALGLDEYFENFAPGDQGALDASLARRVKQKKAVIGYYWEPTTLVSRLGLVRLGMGEHDPEKWKCLTSVECENPEATAWVTPDVLVVAAKALDKDPRIKDFLSKFNLDNDALGRTLVWLNEESASYEEGAMHFMKTESSSWEQWVDEVASKKIKESLNSL